MASRSNMAHCSQARADTGPQRWNQLLSSAADENRLLSASLQRLGSKGLEVVRSDHEHSARGVCLKEAAGRFQGVNTTRFEVNNVDHPAVSRGEPQELCEATYGANQSGEFVPQQRQQKSGEARVIVKNAHRRSHDTLVVVGKIRRLSEVADNTCRELPSTASTGHPSTVVMLCRTASLISAARLCTPSLLMSRLR